jgi:hypothetical protein
VLFGERSFGVRAVDRGSEAQRESRNFAQYELLPWDIKTGIEDLDKIS